MDIYEFLRVRLREMRRGKGLTQRQVADRAGLAPSSYSSIENGGHRLTIESLKKILQALETEISEIWPSRWNQSFDPSFVPAINHFRLREIQVLSGAESACLIFGRDQSLEIVSWINLESGQGDQLCAAIRQRENIADWKFLTRKKGRFSIYLCLKSSVLEGFVTDLADCYLSRWLAAKLL